MKNKKTVMAFASIMIIIFLYWISIEVNAEYFISKTAYIGVDIFFFVSLYSLSKSQISSFLGFVTARFKAVYLKFILFSLIWLLRGGFSIKSFFLTITLAQLFTKGGGSFLWFIPAIMLVYLVFPLFQKCDKANRRLTLCIVLCMYVTLAIIFSKVLVYRPIFIVLNRIPIMLLGYYMGCLGVFDRGFDKQEISSMVRVVIALALIIAGYFLIYKCAYKYRLQRPFVDTFYIVAALAVVGLVMLLSMVPEGRLTRWIGSSTLEIYGLEHIIGYPIIKYLYYIRGLNRILTNVLTMGLILAASICLHYGYEAVVKRLKRGRH